jgi:anti-sigma factor RsiW
MNPRILDILSHYKGEIPAEHLSKYVKGELSETECFEVERLLEQSDSLEKDAWEGWQLGESTTLLAQADAINKHLENKLKPKDRKSRKRPITQLSITWIFITLIIILALIAWGIINAML